MKALEPLSENDVDNIIVYYKTTIIIVLLHMYCYVPLLIIYIDETVP